MISKMLVTKISAISSLLAKVVTGYHGKNGVYISLNHPATTSISLLEEAQVDTRNLTVIDCMDPKQETYTFIHPSDLHALLEECKKVASDTSFILIDAFFSLTIYNTKEDLLSFTKKLFATAKEYDIDIVTIGASGKNENLRQEFYDLFDEVSNVDE